MKLTEDLRGPRPVWVSALSTCSVCALACSASAQSAEEIVPVDLGTIIIDARKVQEPLKNVPFGISVFGQAELDEQRIDDPLDLSRATPGLNLSDTGLRGSNIPNIRGVGSFFPQSADDTSVPVFVDGIALPVRAQDVIFFDVERVDVLRGPQNTIYGRNAQAGAINISTADPTFEPEYRLNFELGEDGYGRARAIVSGPVSETVAYRFGVQYQTQDGNVPNVSSIGGALRDNEQTNIAGKLLWQPSDLTDVRLALRYGNYDETPVQGILVGDPDFPRAAVDFIPTYELKTLGLGLTVEHQFERFRFTSVTGIQGYDSRYQADDTDGLIFGDISGFPPEAFDNPNADFRIIEDDDSQYSQEFRLDGAFANGGSWIAGVNAFRTDLDLDLTFNATGFINGEFDNSFTTTGYGVFGEATVPVSDRVNLIGGLRYTYEDKSFTSNFTDNSGGILGANASDSDSDTFSYVTGRAGLTFDLTEDVTIFASLARGAKSGGFQIADTDLANGAAVSSFDSAFTNTAEIGVRGTVLDSRLNFSTSVFLNDTKDEHLQVFDLATFQSVIENADTETYGLEIEAGFQVTPALRFEGGISLLHTEITASDDPTVQVGNEVPFAPAVSYSVAINHQSDLRLFNRAGVLNARLEYQYVGSRTVDPQNSADLDSYGLVDLRVGWQRGGTEIYAFVDNLLDENYAESAFVFGANPSGVTILGGVPGNPRRIGVGVDMRF